jgi:ABC-type nitrate/sulfonate/bicarbonate transport system permease component
VINVQEKPIRVLDRLERNLRYLLGSLASTVLVPIVMLIVGLGDPTSLIISIIAGLVAFILGAYGIRLVKRIHECG